MSGDRASRPGLAAVFAAQFFLAGGFDLLPAGDSSGKAPDPEASAHGDILAKEDWTADVTAARPYGLRQVGSDARYLVTRPLHLDRKGWIKLSATFGTAGVLFLLRNRIRDEAQEDRSGGRDRFLQDVRVMGKGAFAPSLALVAYGASFLTREDRERETAVLLLESMGFTALGTGTGQFILASERPTDGNEVHFLRRGGHGFSGDAGLAASVVAPLRCQYLRTGPEDSAGRRFWKRSALGVLYAGAGLTAFQRVNHDRHWAPDAFLGMATGLAVGGALCDSHEQARKKRGSVSLEGAATGASLRIRF